MHPRVADYPRRLDVERVTYGFPGIFEEAGIYGGCRRDRPSRSRTPCFHSLIMNNCDI